MSKLATITSLALALLAAARAEAQAPPPAVEVGHVDDRAGLFTPEDRRSLTARSMQFERTDGVRLLIRTLPTSEGLTLQACAARELAAWPHPSRACLVLVTATPRQMWIEPTPLLAPFFVEPLAQDMSPHLTRGVTNALDEALKHVSRAIFEAGWTVGPAPEWLRDENGVFSYPDRDLIDARARRLGLARGCRLRIFCPPGYREARTAVWYFDWWGLGDTDILLVIYRGGRAEVQLACGAAAKPALDRVGGALRDRIVAGFRNVQDYGWEYQATSGPALLGALEVLDRALVLPPRPPGARVVDPADLLGAARAVPLEAALARLANEAKVDSVLLALPDDSPELVTAARLTWGLGPRHVLFVVVPKLERVAPEPELADVQFVAVPRLLRVGAGAELYDRLGPEVEAELVRRAGAEPEPTRALEGAIARTRDALLPEATPLQSSLPAPAAATPSPVAPEPAPPPPSDGSLLERLFARFQIPSLCCAAVVVLLIGLRHLLANRSRATGSGDGDRPDRRAG